MEYWLRVVVHLHEVSYLQQVVCGALFVFFRARFLIVLDGCEGAASRRRFVDEAGVLEKMLL